MSSTAGPSARSSRRWCGQARGRPGVLRGGARHGQRGQRGEARARPDADEQRDREPVGPVGAAVRGGQGERGRSAAIRPGRGSARTGTGPHGQTVGGPDRRRAHRPPRPAGRPGRSPAGVALDLPRVQRAEEEHGERPRGAQHLDPARAVRSARRRSAAASAGAAPSAAGRWTRRAGPARRRPGRASSGPAAGLRGGSTRVNPASVVAAVISSAPGTSMPTRRPTPRSGR